MKKIIINSIIIFLICSLFHFGYDFMPNFITSLFFPVNESIWEHLKMVFTSTIVFSFISNLFYHDKNTLFKSYIRTMATIIILLILYLPTYYLLGEIMILTLIILFISIFLSEVIASKISTKKHYKYLNIISAILLILNFTIFAIFTYNPPHQNLFKDPESKEYGI